MMIQRLHKKQQNKNIKHMVLLPNLHIFELVLLPIKFIGEIGKPKQYDFNSISWLLVIFF